MSSHQHTKVGFTFTKLFVPLQDVNECMIDIRYENNNHRFSYPQSEPYYIPILDPPNVDNKLDLTLLVKSGNKFKKIAKATINLYKKNYSGGVTKLTKWVPLELFTTSFDALGHETLILTAMNNTGKIYMNAEMKLEEVDESNLRNKLKISAYDNVNHAMNKAIKEEITVMEKTKDKTSQNKTDRFKSVIEGNNEYLKNLKKNMNAQSEDDIFEDIIDSERQRDKDDGLSDMSISIIDGTEEYHTELKNMDYDTDLIIQNIKQLFEENKEQILPREEADLKPYGSYLLQQFNTLSPGYFKNLNDAHLLNKNLKDQAKDFYNQYKDLKHSFLRDRKILHQKETTLAVESKLNIEENTKLLGIHNELTNELSYIRKKFGLKDKLLTTDEDIVNICDLLNSVKGQIDIFEGLNDNDVLYLRKLMEHYCTQNYSENLKLINKIEQLFYNLEKDKKARRVEVKHDYENRFYFGPNIHVTVVDDPERLRVIESDTGNEYYLDDWLCQTFKPPDDKKKFAIKQEAAKAMSLGVTLKTSSPSIANKGAPVIK